MRRGCQQGPTISNCSYGLYNCVPRRTRIRRWAIATLHKLPDVKRKKQSLTILIMIQFWASLNWSK